MHNNTEFKLMMQTEYYYANTQSITQEWAEFSVKGSGLSPQDSTRLRVEVPLWLSWLNTSVSKQSQAYIN